METRLLRSQVNLVVLEIRVFDLLPGPAQDGVGLPFCPAESVGSWETWWTAGAGLC